MITRYYTDYPIVALGDKPQQEAPIREVTILKYDGNKYCTVKIDGVTPHIEIKAGYIYIELSLDGKAIGVWKLANLGSIDNFPR